MEIPGYTGRCTACGGATFYQKCKGCGADNTGSFSNKKYIDRTPGSCSACGFSPIASWMTVCKCCYAKGER